MGLLLRAEGLAKRFGGLTALSDVGFDLDSKEILGVIGPNGAGKTTLFNTIAGVHRPTAGRVTFGGQDITGLAANRIAALGIGRTFQAATVLKELTVEENLLRAAEMNRVSSPWRLFARQPASTAALLSDVAEMIGLTDMRDRVASTLSYGYQKMLGLGMTLMIQPTLIMMDEPAAGLNPSEKRGIGELILKLRDRLGISVLLIEHDMPLVMGVCDRILVVNQGRPVATGSPAQIAEDPRVIEAYLGEDYDFA